MGKPAVVLFHMQGCPWCQAMMPEWEKFESSHGSDFDIRKYESNEMPAGFAVQSFPTIVVADMDAAKILAYYTDEKHRTADKFAAFARKHMKKGAGRSRKSRRTAARASRRKSRAGGKELRKTRRHK